MSNGPDPTHERTSPVWPTNLRVVKPVLRSQRRRVLSQDEERANWPSEEMTTSETKWLWPWRIFLGKPKLPSSRVSCQTMTVLSEGCQRGESARHAHQVEVVCSAAPSSGLSLPAPNYGNNSNIHFQPSTGLDHAQQWSDVPGPCSLIHRHAWSTHNARAVPNPSRKTPTHHARQSGSCPGSRARWRWR
jgi:hypothetical protein